MENFNNIHLVPKEQSSKPGKFKGEDPSRFLGGYVKLGFLVQIPDTDQESVEHMWVKVDASLPDPPQNGHTLMGVLDNDPILHCEYQRGDGVAFNVDEIEEFISAGQEIA